MPRATFPRLFFVSALFAGCTDESTVAPSSGLHDESGVPSQESGVAKGVALNDAASNGGATVVAADPQPESGDAEDERPANRLIHEKSPYLLQHARNPVDWYPWGEEAFAKAKAEDKPVFLSIGYSTCFWCHVMERESFEDEVVAKYLNEHFVAIKVDREERPDVDATYMSYVQAVTGRGGWPMTVFLTEARIPFYGGTYYPPTRREGMPGFMDVLVEIDRAWREDRAQLLSQADMIVETLKARAEGGLGEGLLKPALLSVAYDNYRAEFDDRYGGTRRAPKFPAPMMLRLLLRYEQRTGEARALEMVEKTLLSMADGGIYDQLGGGFARYSTDEKWRVPHFEKMLYSQGMLARVYTEAWQRTKDPRYEEVVRGILDYVLRDMRTDGGGFASAEDAETEGEEGRFYTWTPAEMHAVLGDELAEVAIQAYGVTEAGDLDGRSVLRRKDFEGVDPAKLEEARSLLFTARAERTRPIRDDKVLTSWNALMISAFATAGRAFREPRYLAAATAAAVFVRDHLIDDEGWVHRRYRDGEVIGPGFLDDHAYLAAACLDLYEATFAIEWFDLGRKITEDAVVRFGDEETGAFFETSTASETLITRARSAADDALPAAGAVLAMNLLRLSDALADPTPKERAQRCLRAYAQSMEQVPLAYVELLNAFAWSLEPPREIVFAGELGAPDLDALVDHFYTGFTPFRVLAHAPTDAAVRDALAERLPIVAERVPVDGRAAAYWCENYTCRAPVTEPGELFRLK